MITKELVHTRYLKRCEADTHDFIGHLLKGWFSHRLGSVTSEDQNQQPGMVVNTTIQKPYTIDDLRRIIETPSHVLRHYNLTFINNQVIVTVEVMRAETQSYEEAIV